MSRINFIIICALVGQTVCVNIRRNYSSLAHPGRCVIEKLDLILSSGVIKHPKECEQIYCSSDGTAMFVDCGPNIPPKNNCYVGEFIDKSKPFPECCKRKTYCPRTAKRPVKEV